MNTIKTVKLALTETTFRRATDLAQQHDVEAGQFMAMILAEAITDIYTNKNDGIQTFSPGQKNTDTDLPDTVKQLQELCRSVWIDKISFKEALRRTAYMFDVNESTVRDKYSRRIGVQSRDEFLALLAKPESLIAHLCKRFPNNADQIRQSFEDIASATNGHPSPPQPRAQQPQHVLTSLEFIKGFIPVIKRHGGKAEKTVVEAEVFDQFKELFSHPWYQEEVGGVPRWKKNLQFARNDACHKLGLLKTPEESGRGVWELTQAGFNWVGARKA